MDQTGEIVAIVGDLPAAVRMVRHTIDGVTVVIKSRSSDDPTVNMPVVTKP